MNEAHQDLEKTPLVGTQGGKDNFSAQPNPRDIPMPGNSGGPSKAGSGVPDMTKGDGQSKNDDEDLDNEKMDRRKNEALRSQT